MAVTDIAEVDEVIEEAQPEAVMPSRRRWTREEYYRAAEVGIFGPEERLELIDGEVYHKVSPINRSHSLSVLFSERAFQKVIGSDFHVQREQPLRFPNDSEPQPDIAIVRGQPEDYPEHPPQPADAILVMEISDANYSYDTTLKASLYASVGIPEYWVLDLRRNRLEVRREPQTEEGVRFGHKYQQLIHYTASEVVSLLPIPSAEIRVSDLLPIIPEAKPQQTSKVND
jgi:Uma2 family endonuclease